MTLCGGAMTIHYKLGIPRILSKKMHNNAKQFYYSITVPSKNGKKSQDDVDEVAVNKFEPSSQSTL